MGTKGRGTSEPEARARFLRALADLADDVATRFRARRQSRQPPDSDVRITRRAALLAIASAAAATAAAACAPALPTSATSTSPLGQEVNLGMPAAPGRYDVDQQSIARDDQGVYSFAWRPFSGTTSTGNWTYASSSDLRLYPAGQALLEVVSGQAPVLYLPRNSSISLLGTQGGSYGSYNSTYGWSNYPYYASRSPGRIGTWRPFTGTSAPTRPVYYSPPRTISPGGVSDGGSVSDHAPSFGSRTFGLTRAVSGRLGGTGAGNAVTAKSGAHVSTASSEPASHGFSVGHGSSSGASVG